MIFEVGGHYHNNFGEYEVLTLKGDSMEVQYLDGHRQTLTIERQARIQENRVLAQVMSQKSVSRSRRRVSYGSRDYWTLGFLLARLSHLGLNIMSEKEEIAKRDYFDATGEELDLEQVGVSCLRDGANQWGNQGVITFRSSTNELLSLKFKGEPYSVHSSTDTYEVKDIGYVRFMWEQGFRMGSGSKQDKDRIESAIPNKYLDAFKEGYSRGLK